MRRMMASVAALAWLTFLSTSASAQTTGTIAGVVKDASGAVLPGVTVDASSPALIEKVRTVVTDDRGEYKIVALRPGTYNVTFSLAGFSTLKREGIELTANITVQVSIELKVGAIEETVTVSGAAPTIDVQTVTQQKTFSRELLDTMPTAKGMLSFAALTPAAVSPPTAVDVGGSLGEQSVRMTIHGGKQGDQKLLQDGMRYNSLVQGGTGRAFFINPASSEEIVVELAAGGSAEVDTGGVYINLVPKDGGNTFHGYVFTAYTGHGLQSDNLTPELQARLLKTINKVHDIYDMNAAFGGPIKADKLWYFTAHRHWGQSISVPNLYKNATQGPPYVFTSDLSQPVYAYGVNYASNVRLTWQASQKAKVTMSWDYQNNCACDRPTSQLAWEAANLSHYGPINNLIQTTWTYPASNKLLLSAGATVLYNKYPTVLKPGVTMNDISVLEQSNSLRYNAPATSQGYQNTSQTNERFSLSYVTGSHNFKSGVFYQYGFQQNKSIFNNYALNFRLNNGSPNQITEYASDLQLDERLSPDFAAFAQDQWTRGRLTLSGGLRFNYIRAYIPPQDEPAGLVPARSFDRVDCVPCWTDLNPRLAASFDLFGNGKTALKAAIGRYVTSETVFNAMTYNPATTSVNSVTRIWNDVNKNFFPDCDLRNTGISGECQPMSDAAFGQLKVTTRPDPDTMNGFGKRGYNWQASVSIENELRPGLSVSGGYYRAWYGNFLVTNNLAVTPEDYNSYCFTAPIDSRLPDGGGNQICGLYDLNPTKFAKIDNVVTFAKNFGTQTEIYNGVDVNMNARLPHGAMVSGGVNVGNSISGGTTVGTNTTTSSTNSCFVVDSPQQMRFCDVHVPYQARFKMSGSTPLPAGFQASMTFQVLPGAPIGATFNVPNALVLTSLGRGFSGGTSAPVELMAPFSQFEAGIRQLDVRLTKRVKIGRTRINGNFDIYNMLNASPVVSMNTTFGGTAWLTPTLILDGRLFKFSAQLEF